MCAILLSQGPEHTDRIVSPELLRDCPHLSAFEQPSDHRGESATSLICRPLFRIRPFYSFAEDAAKPFVIGCFHQERVLTVFPQPGVDIDGNYAPRRLQMG